MFLIPPDGAVIGQLPTDDSVVDFFGVDVLFDGGTRTTVGGDYAEVDGMDALRQVVRSRLLTSPGEYASRPTYGCGLREFVKKRSTQSQRDALRQRIIEQISQEERVQSVDEVTVSQITRNGVPGVQIFLRITALGRTNSLTETSFVG